MVDSMSPSENYENVLYLDCRTLVMSLSALYTVACNDCNSKTQMISFMQILFLAPERMSGLFHICFVRCSYKLAPTH